MNSTSKICIGVRSRQSGSHDRVDSFRRFTLGITWFGRTDERAHLDCALTAVLLGVCAGLLAACGGSSPTGSTTPALVSIDVAPLTTTLPTAATQQLTVTGHYTDGSTKTLPAAGELFASNDAQVVTVNTDGLVTAVAPGNTTVSVTDMGSNLVASAPPAFTVPPDGRVFCCAGDYDPGVSFSAFAGSSNSPLPAPDPANPYNGVASLKANVTATGNSSGGALVANTARDLSSFNALTFYASADKTINSLIVGIGNDGSISGTAFSAQMANVALTVNFSKYVIPLPDPNKIGSQVGLFHFADGPHNYNVWFNNVQYESLPSGQLLPPTAATAVWGAGAVQAMQLGTPYRIGGVVPANTVTFTVPSVTLTNVAWRWFSLSSDNPAVATVNADGVVTPVSVGTAHISSTIHGLTVPGHLTVTVTTVGPGLSAPTTVAPTPTIPAAQVTSFFSSAYTNISMATWLGNPLSAELVDPYLIGAHAVKKYTLYNDAEAIPSSFVSLPPLTHFHMDVWSPDPPADLQIQLTNCIIHNGVVNGPPIDIGLIQATTWVSVDVPLPFIVINLEPICSLFIIASSPAVVYVDNIYLYH